MPDTGPRARATRASRNLGIRHGSPGCRKRRANTPRARGAAALTLDRVESFLGCATVTGHRTAALLSATGPATCMHVLALTDRGLERGEGELVLAQRLEHCPAKWIRFAGERAPDKAARADLTLRDGSRQSARRSEPAHGGHRQHRRPGLRRMDLGRVASGKPHRLLLDEICRDLALRPFGLAQANPTTACGT
jgi:hypothetical protein